MGTHILVVDDEKELADVLELYLVSDGSTVHKCYTGTEAQACIECTDLDLAILDVMLPDADGFQLCKKIREKSYCPIIMLTARAADGDKIMGLTIGADDYITKPFNPLEVSPELKPSCGGTGSITAPFQSRRNRSMNTTSGGWSSIGTTTSASCSGRKCS